jgi:hypothetical protein
LLRSPCEAREVRSPCEAREVRSPSEAACFAGKKQPFGWPYSVRSSPPYGKRSSLRVGSEAALPKGRSSLRLRTQALLRKKQPLPTAAYAGSSLRLRTQALPASLVRSSPAEQPYGCLFHKLEAAFGCVRRPYSVRSSPPYGKKQPLPCEAREGRPASTPEGKKQPCFAALAKLGKGCEAALRTQPKGCFLPAKQAVLPTGRSRPPFPCFAREWLLRWGCLFHCQRTYEVRPCFFP